MAITETILGPNSSALVISGTGETAATMMVAVNNYIVNHGWELHDDNAVAAPSVGRVYRTLQSGSTTTYKYVLVAFTAASYQITPYETWNATTHTGTNPITMVSTGSVLSGVHAQSLTYADGASMIFFVNKKWLAARFRTHTLIHGDMVGSFEISKDFGESDSVPSNILMTTMTPTSYPANNQSGIYGTMAFNNASAISNNVSANANIVTAIGMPAYGLALNRLLTNVVRNSALTMTAVETSGGSSYGVSNLRGRIFGIKLVAGLSVWNDMDTAQILIDSDFHQSALGEPVKHHIVATSINYVRFLIPA